MIAIVAGSASAQGNIQAPVTDGVPSDPVTQTVPGGPAQTVTTLPITTPALPPATVPVKKASLPSAGLNQTLSLFELQALRPVNKQILTYRKTAWHWQRLLGVHPTQSSYSPAKAKSLAYGKWVLSLWKQRSKNLRLMAKHYMAQRIQYFRSTVDHWNLVMGAKPVRMLAVSGNLETQFLQWRQTERRVLEQAAHPPYASQFSCIHRYEGSWSDPNSPYYGGLQMDLGFQSTYGGYLLRTKGTADHWTPLEQMWVAARAVRSGRGFYPWPNSARICGYI